VAQQTQVAADCKFVSLHELDLIETGGGVNEIVRYLKRNSRIIQNRPINAPLIVLFDWDVIDQELNKAREHYGTHADLRVQRMNVSHADPRISSEINGIERFYPVELFHEARKLDILDVAIDQDGNISIEKGKLREAKSKLADMLCQAQDKRWYRHIQKVLEDVQISSYTLLGDQIELH